MRIKIDPAFDLDLPNGWTAEPDEEGGIAVTGPAGIGLLHLIAFEQSGGELLDRLGDQALVVEALELPLGHRARVRGR